MFLYIFFLIILVYNIFMKEGIFMADTRIPTQARSIEKKNKIIEKGFELICNEGYYHINTKDIAEYAGVSTGIVYQYFHDKKEIFLEGVKNYSDKIFYPALNILSSDDINGNSISDLIEQIIDQFIQNHTISFRAHEELMAMTYLDEDVANLFKEKELDMTDRIVNVLENQHIYLSNIREKVHLIISIVDNFCHEVVYHKHDSINYDNMKKEVIEVIKFLLK